MGYFHKFEGIMMRTGYGWPFLFLIIMISCRPSLEANRYTTWRVYGGDPGGTKYSALDQINRANVQQMTMAWTYRTDDSRDDPPSTIECTPIVVDSVMYLTTPGLKVVALHAATGQEIWRYDPFVGGRPSGVTYWEDGDDRRILMTAGPYIHALHAATGQLIPEFGDSGKVDLRHGLDRDIGDLSVTASSPGVIYEDLYITGSSVGEGPRPAARGNDLSHQLRRVPRTEPGRRRPVGAGHPGYPWPVA